MLGGKVVRNQGRVDSSFYEVDYKVAGEKDLILSIEELIVLETNEDASGFTDVEIECQLEKSSYYRRVVYEAYLLQRRYRKGLQLDLERWYANATAVAEPQIIHGKQGLGIKASSTLLSAEKVKNWLLAHETYGIEYNNRKRKINDAQADEDSLKELADNIRDRAMVLSSILKRI